MAGNLTRDEARARAKMLSVTSYVVELDLTGDQETFRSATTARFSCRRPGARTFIELAAERVDEITLNGRPIDPTTAVDAERGRIELDDLAADNELRVVANCAYMRTGEGLHRFVDPVDAKVYLHSQAETSDAHRIYACFDQPDLKATFELAVTAPSDWEVISNSAPDLVREPVRLDVRRWHFAVTPRLPTYITAVIAGPYHVERSEHDGIPLGLYCRASIAQHLDPDNIFAVTRQGLDFFQRVFGRRYPFGKYDQLFVPEFNAGAMENAGCVTFLEDYVFRSRVTDTMYERRAETILHEMAHMWFGNLVTMRWWDDLWLNESFATYAAYLAQTEATRWTNAWTTFANALKAWAYRQDQLPSTHPIAADIPDVQAVEVNFDGITYAKGASVLKQLVAWVGREKFLAGLRAYFDRHAWDNTELSDLLTALERASGRDLTAWSQEWLETAGVNTLRPEFTLDNEGRFAEFAVRQEAPRDHPTLRSHRIAIGLYDLTEREGSPRFVRRDRVELDVTGARTGVGELAGRAKPDVILLNDDDLGYTKIRLDEDSLRTLIDNISHLQDPLPRALVWSAAWDMTRDAEMAARDFVKLVISGVPTLTDISVAQTLLRQARTAVEYYGAPGWRENGRIALGDFLYRCVRVAQAGSDFQLAYTQSLADVAYSQTHLELIRGLLDGAPPIGIEGLVVDTELRWALLLRLVARGRAGEHEIATELRRDPTSTGERRAATCRAAIPLPDAKEAAWQRIATGNQMANAMFRALVTGFFDPDSGNLLGPYADKYFDIVGKVWKDWTPDMAQTFAVRCYPSLVIEPRTIQRTEAYIAQASPPPPLRRLLLEGADGICRALRARERDHAAGQSLQTPAPTGQRE